MILRRFCGKMGEIESGGAAKAGEIAVQAERQKNGNVTAKRLHNGEMAA